MQVGSQGHPSEERCRTRHHTIHTAGILGGRGRWTVLRRRDQLCEPGNQPRCEATRLKELERENARLKMLVAGRDLEVEVLREVLRKES